MPCEETAGPPPFGRALADAGLSLTRGKTTALQVNVGLACNLSCRHCHVEAGPDRREAMDETTVRQVIDYARRHRFAVADLTGGAPEMNPHLPTLVEGLAPLVEKLMVRTNLTLLARPPYDRLVDLFASRRVALVGSLPSLNREQTDAQRGEGVFDRIMESLTRLNGKGYGVEGSGLTLDLVANPTGAFLSPAQEGVEKRFREILARKGGIRFSHLFAFANVPLGRFGQWLDEKGARQGYYQKLADSFNPCAVGGVMCRTQISVGWDGALYDCDFHLANGTPLKGGPLHVGEGRLPEPGAPIALCDYCYTCTAGSGFTCGGSIE
ncbi:MAG: arsenosugar biosynthesis radical SAM protein ArsS [Nitrospinae bacterium]|nr:arsenosugar biosynthesis radical SAM protein ArsS [Nitrospinota bacterium]